MVNRLEYRLWLGEENYRLLYFYESIDLPQIIARRECEFFVKEGVAYQQVSSALEHDTFVIYVEEYERGPKEAEVDSNDLLLEVRELDAENGHPVIATLELPSSLDVMAYIGNSFTYFQGKEWLRDSSEIDEDRKVYVLYVTATGFVMEEGETNR
ncbi:hypothetical protein HNR78_002262 [Parageobacillus toebii NBRC 107807]|uniref:Uncharacterized protein n=1 Tax=Parageobacillus toebii NBRC 107807 TaxID=1223503 RepID=A0AA89SSJ4_9BACL|nr:hypothetical protein [Parageobacillus toebii NBRC 107807]